MTVRRQQFAWVVASLIGCASLGATRSAWAQAAAREQSGTVTAAPTSTGTQTWRERFAGSFAELSTYVGSGSFYTSGYRDPYVSNALYLRPSYQLGTKYKLALNARVYLEEEYTTPDTLNARRFYPLDSWLFLSAKNLAQIPRAGIIISGTARLVIPTSYESRYAHLVTSTGVGLAATRPFEFGRPDAQGKRWGLVLSLAESFSKAIRTSATRGNFAGDTSGCRAVAPNGTGNGGGGAADTDRCGGPLNTSYSFMTSGTVALSRGKLSLSTTLIIINEFKYSIDAITTYQIYDQTHQIPQGRNDWTWGIVALSYELSEHLGLSAGLASYQPALDSRYQNIRFPYFDFAGGNANNFTQVFVSLTGTL